MSDHSTFTVSVIVPVYNGGVSFSHCLDALRSLNPPPLEILVVDDGSRDGSRETAAQHGARVLNTLHRQSGPAVARNLGAQHAQGALLFFVDADVVVAGDACARLAAAFADPSLDALFGSYDDTPAGQTFVAQYKNLLHHYTHQRAQLESNSFWAGCGAIRASVFRSAGGFNPTFTRPCIEDIELGYRLTRAGHKIHIDKTLQVKHLKQWTLRSMIHSDIFDRALPWSRLLKAERTIPRDLNLQASNRVSAGLSWLLVATFCAAWFNPLLWLVAVVEVTALLLLNLDLYRFFLRARGLAFVARAIPLHWLYYLYSSASFAYVWFIERKPKT